MGNLRKILIALDATDEAEEVLDSAMALAPQGSVEFEVITVIPPVTAGASGIDGANFAASWPLVEMEETIVAETARNIRERVAAYGIEPDQVITRIGRPSSEIRAQAEKSGADLIVIGSHGRHGLAGLLLGSTANGVIHGAPCNVLTVRVGATDE